MSQLIKFCLTLKENEDELQKHAKNGLLEEFYASITNNMMIDEENESKAETLIVKVEEDDTDYEEYERLKNEDSSEEFNETRYSSDNEISQSYIKKETIIETTSIEEPQQFRPIRGLENFKRKRKAEPQIFEFVKQFTCLSCLKQCENQSDLAKHYYAEHYSNPNARKKYTEHKLEDKTIYSCDICEETFDLKKDAVKHAMTHSDERPLTCKICGKISLCV